MPALLDGTFKLLVMLDALEHYTPEELRGFANAIIHGSGTEGEGAQSV